MAYTFQLAGSEVDKVAQAQNDQNLLNLQFQLELIRLQKDEMYLLGKAARSAFEGGMSTAIDDLLTGKESSLKDSMAKLAKGVFEGISKQLSSRMSESISNFLFGDNKLKPYLLEFNKGPELGCVKGINIECDIKRKLQKDIFEIVNIIPKITKTNGFTKII